MTSTKLEFSHFASQIQTEVLRSLAVTRKAVAWLVFDQEIDQSILNKTSNHTTHVVTFITIAACLFLFTFIYIRALRFNYTYICYIIYYDYKNNRRELIGKERKSRPSSFCQAFDRMSMYKKKEKHELLYDRTNQRNVLSIPICISSMYVCMYVYRFYLTVRSIRIFRLVVSFLFFFLYKHKIVPSIKLVLI